MAGGRQITLTAPDGWEFDDGDQPRVPRWPIDKGKHWWDGPDSYGVPVEVQCALTDRHYVLRRTAPDMVAVMLPRDVAEHYIDANGHHVHTCVEDDALEAAAREALARTAVLIAGPAGCAEVSVDDARQTAGYAMASSYGNERRVGEALRKATGGE
jgi:hypothetical protein